MARIRFQPGREIEPQALNLLQDETLAALRQLRLALGTGAIHYGFDVHVDGESGRLGLGPGLAFDGEGRAVALDRMLTLPLPQVESTLWLCLRHHLLVEQSDALGRPLRERDSVEVVWLDGPPPDDALIPVARLLQGAAGWRVDRSVARRVPPLDHRHTGTTMPDRSHRLRFDGLPVAPRGGAGESGGTGPVEDRLSLLALELEELRAEVAEAAERGGDPASEAGWQEALAALREEMALTAGEEVREELDLLRAELVALADRPASVGADRGGLTAVTALHGVGDAFAEKLFRAGIGTVSDLLAAAGSREARERIEAAGISTARLRRWGREADLLRLHGVGPGEVILFDQIGIGGTADLALWEARPLYEALREAAAATEGSAPALAWVESWIVQARELPPVVSW